MISRCGMNNHTFWFINNQKIVIFVIYIKWNILRFNVKRNSIRNKYCNIFPFFKHFAFCYCLAVYFHVAGRNKLLQSRTGQMVNGFGKKFIGPCSVGFFRNSYYYLIHWHFLRQKVFQGLYLFLQIPLLFPFWPLLLFYRRYILQRKVKMRLHRCIYPQS